VRLGKWKLHVKKSIGWTEENGTFTPLLINLDEDISETTNLAAQEPELVERLSRLIKEFDQRLSEESRPVGTSQE